MIISESTTLQDLDQVDIPRQYARFRGRYPGMGRGFPRRYVDTTPEEILFSSRILGSGRVFMVPTGETVLRQPRVESPGYRMIEL